VSVCVCVRVCVCVCVRVFLCARACVCVCSVHDSHASELHSAMPKRPHSHATTPEHVLCVPHACVCACARACVYVRVHLIYVCVCGIYVCVPTVLQVEWPYRDFSVACTLRPTVPVRARVLSWYAPAACLWRRTCARALYVGMYVCMYVGV
jgi:hypothetical protein